MMKTAGFLWNVHVSTKLYGFTSQKKLIFVFSDADYNLWIKFCFFYVKADPHARADFKTALSRSIVTQSTSHCSSLNTNDVQKLHTVTTLTYHVTSEVPKAIRIRTKLQSSGQWRRVIWTIKRFSVKCLSLLVPWGWRQRVPPEHYYAPQRLRDTTT